MSNSTSLYGIVNESRVETDWCAYCRGMITSTINVLILVPVFFVMMKACVLRPGKLNIPVEGDVCECPSEKRFFS